MRASEGWMKGSTCPQAGEIDRYCQQLGCLYTVPISRTCARLQSSLCVYFTSAEPFFSKSSEISAVVAVEY